MALKKDSPLVSSLKELGRLILLSIVSWLIFGGVDLILNQFGSGLPTDVKIELSGILVGILKALDKYLHEFGKAEDNDTLAKGLTQF